MAVRRPSVRAVSVLLSALLVVIGVGVTIFTPQTAMAAGGVGSGGSGRGGSDGGPWGWTNYGHGWATYSSTGRGPTDGFHTGIWATARDTCRDVSSKVAVYIIGTGQLNRGGATGDYMGYNDVGFRNPWGGGGGDRDNGRATQISRATAKNAFDNLGDYGVSTSRYTWGSNVGWFCYGFYNWRAVPTTTISRTTAAPGDIVTWSHTLRITGAGTAPEKGYLGWWSTTGRSNGAYVTTGDFSRPTAYDFARDIPAGTTYTYGPQRPNRTSNSLTIPAGAGNGDTYCQYFTYSRRAANDAGGGISQQDRCVRVVISPPGGGSGAVVFTTVDYEKGTPADPIITATLTCAATGTINWSLNPPSGLPGGSYSDNCLSIGQSISKSITLPGLTLDGFAPRTYNYTSSLGGSGGVGVYEVPFVHFLGQDTLICGDGDENRFMFDTANPLKGSYGQYATIFANNNMPTTNFNGLNSAQIGGFPAKLRTTWAGISGCNIFDDTQLKNGTPTTSGDVVIDGTAGTYTNGINDIIINSSSSLNATTNKMLVFTEGDIIIRDNPTHEVGINSGGVLLLKGKNIYIDASITRIDAVLVASGTVYTCADTTIKTPYSNDQWVANCRNPLLISGAVHADTVKLMRSTGSRLLANPSAVATQGSAGAPEFASEIISFPKYLNFVNMPLLDNSKQSFDAYYIVPPRL